MSDEPIRSSDKEMLEVVQFLWCKAQKALNSVWRNDLAPHVLQEREEVYEEVSALLAEAKDSALKVHINGFWFHHSAIHNSKVYDIRYKCVNGDISEMDIREQGKFICGTASCSQDLQPLFNWGWKMAERGRREEEKRYIETFLSEKALSQKLFF